METVIHEKHSVMHDQNNQLLRWKNFAIFALSYWLINFILGIVVGFYDAANHKKLTSILFNGYNALIIDAIVFFAILFLYRPLRSYVKSILDFNVLKYKKTYILIIVSLLVIALFQFLTLSLFNIESADSQQKVLDITNGKSSFFNGLLFFFSTVLLTPIKEEFLFRGMLYSLFTRKWNFIIGIIISSILFGVLHSGFPITATLMGITFALGFKLTKSIVPSIIIHIIWNFIALFMLN